MYIYTYILLIVYTGFSSGKCSMSVFCIDVDINTQYLHAEILMVLFKFKQPQGGLCKN